MVDLNRVKLESFVTEFNKIAATAEDVNMNIFDRVMGGWTKWRDDRKTKRKIRQNYESYLNEGNPSMSLEEFTEREKNLAKTKRIDNLKDQYEKWTSQTGENMHIDDFARKLKSGEIQLKASPTSKLMRFAKNHKVGLTMGALGLGAGALLLSKGGASHEVENMTPEDYAMAMQQQQQVM